MKVALVAVVLVLSAACSSAPAPAQPTADSKATISAAVQATVAALVTPTPAAVPTSAAELSQAATRASFLTARYGVPPNEVTSLNKATYDLAAMVGLNTPERRTSLQMLVLDFAEHGGTSLRDFGIEGDDEFIAHQIGLSSASGLAALTPGEVVHARTLVATIGLTKYLIGH